MLDPKAPNLPWTTETDLPYGEQPRIYDATGALVAVVGNAELEKQDEWERNATAIVSAVNATDTTPPDVDGLVERLRDMGGGEHAVATCQEAANIIEAISASLTAERAAHAETKRERDDLKDEWQAEFESRVEANTALRMTKARLDEALKALERHEQGWANVLELDLIPERHRATAEGLRDHAFAARRVREGGKVDG